MRCFLPDIMVITSSRMRWLGNVTCIRKSGMHAKFNLDNLTESCYLGDLGADGCILKFSWINRL